MGRVKRRDPEAALKNLADPLLRERYGTPVPATAPPDRDLAALDAALDAVAEENRRRVLRLP